MSFYDLIWQAEEGGFLQNTTTVVNDIDKLRYVQVMGVLLQYDQCPQYKDNVNHSSNQVGY